MASRKDETSSPVSTAPGAPERRRHRRFPAAYPVWLCAEGAVDQQSGWVINESIGGIAVLVSSEFRPDLKSKLVVTDIHPVERPAVASTMLPLLGSVVRVEDSAGTLRCIAIAFDPETTRQRELHVAEPAIRRKSVAEEWVLPGKTQSTAASPVTASASN